MRSAKVSTRKAYGEALAALGGEQGDIVVLDGEVSNSTFAEIFRDAHPDRFFEMYIAEQQMVAAAVGLQVLGWKPFCSPPSPPSCPAPTTSSAWPRQPRDAEAVRLARRRLDRRGRPRPRWASKTWPSSGRSTARPCSTTCDGNQTAKLVRAMADLDGISYARRARIPPCSTDGRRVSGGRLADAARGGRRRARGGRDHRARGTAGGGRARRRRDLRPRVDCYSVKPIDAETPAARSPADRHGGGPSRRGRSRRGRARRSRRAWLGVACGGSPSAGSRSGKPAELLGAAGIDAAAIADAAPLVRRPSRRAALAVTTLTRWPS